MKSIEKVYISHLVDEKVLKRLLEQYPVGIESIEFSISDVLDLGEEGVKKYVQQLAPYINQRPLSLHGPFFDLHPATFDSKIRSVVKKRFEEVYEIAKQLKADRVIYHTGFIPITYYIEGWLGNSITFWREFMKDKDESIQVHLENVYEKEFYPMVEVIETVNHPAFTACLDIGHVNAYSHLTIGEWIDGLGSHIGHVHLHNNEGDRDAHQSLIRGTLNMEEILTHIQRVSPHTTYTIEIANKQQLEESLDWLYGVV